MALDTRLPLLAGQQESPLMALGRGIQSGQQMAATKQAMDLQKQQAEQAKVKAAQDSELFGMQKEKFWMEKEALQSAKEKFQREKQLQDLTRLGGAIDSVMGYSNDPLERQKFARNIIDSLGLNIPPEAIDSPDDFTDDALSALKGSVNTATQKMTEFQKASLEQRKQQLAFEQKKEQRQAEKLSAGLEKSLIESQDATVEAQRNANNYELLAQDFERLNIGGGLKTTFSETMKEILGTQDDVTEFRRQFNKVRLSEGLRNLPPGPATDRDVKEAFKGVPPENAPAEQVASFLRGAAKIARFDAGYNQFKADYISENSSTKGLNKKWRESVISPKLGREVSTAEIYATAQNRGITPEEVRERLGL